MSFDSEVLSLEDSEIINLIYQTATLISLLYNKKINLQNLFILFLSDKKINFLVKEILDIDSDLEICSILFAIDPSLVKSKLITSYSNSIKHG